MEVVVEIGTPEERVWIKEELAFPAQTFMNAQPSVDLRIVVLAEHFAAKVNELEGISRYIDKRGVEGDEFTAVGRVVRLEEGFGIVLSPLVYAPSIPAVARLFIISHEFAHLIYLEPSARPPKART